MYTINGQNDDVVTSCDLHEAVDYAACIPGASVVLDQTGQIIFENVVGWFRVYDAHGALIGVYDNRFDACSDACSDACILGYGNEEIPTGIPPVWLFVPSAAYITDAYKNNDGYIGLGESGNFGTMDGGPLNPYNMKELLFCVASGPSETEAGYAHAGSMIRHGQLPWSDAATNEVERLITNVPAWKKWAGVLIEAVYEEGGFRLWINNLCWNDADQYYPSRTAMSAWWLPRAHRLDF